MKKNDNNKWTAFDPKKILRIFYDVRLADGQEYLHCWSNDQSFHHSRYVIRFELVTHVRESK